jgi:hypothetical protein
MHTTSAGTTTTSTPAYQASAEPMHRPDHKAKKHGRPHRWEERHARRERQSREWGL